VRSTTYFELWAAMGSTDISQTRDCAKPDRLTHRFWAIRIFHQTARCTAPKRISAAGWLRLGHFQEGKILCCGPAMESFTTTRTCCLKWDPITDNGAQQFGIVCASTFAPTCFGASTQPPTCPISYPSPRAAGFRLAPACASSVGTMQTADLYLQYWFRAGTGQGFLGLFRLHSCAGRTSDALSELRADWIISDVGDVFVTKRRR